VTSLALGIGANTAIFTLVDAILLRWLPVENPQELVTLARNPSLPTTGASYPDYCYLRDHSRSYAGLIAFWSGGVTRLSLPRENASSQMIALALVSGNYFEALGVAPDLGRMFNPTDNERQGAHPYVILSHAFWKRTFGGDTSVIGRDILLNGARLQVVGVAREGFTGTTVGVAPDVFVPIIMQRTFWPNDVQALTNRNAGWVTMMGRLKPGVSRTQAEAELNVLWRQVLDSDPKQREVKSWRKDYNLINKRLLLAGSSGNSDLRNQASRPLTILMITSGFVLLIACANVANLLLARGVARRREIAVRLAVGAKRSRLVMQMLTESITLSAIGAAAGLALAWVGVRLLLRFLPTGAVTPLELNLSPDVRLLSFTFAVMMISGLAFGLAPAIRASRPELVEALKSDAAFSQIGRSARWDLGRTLVSLQVTLSLLLLGGAGLFVRTLANLRSVDFGMDREHLLFIDTNMVQTGYQPQRARSFYERLREEAQRLPGVRASSTASMVPFGNTRPRDQVQIEGYRWTSDEPRIVDMNAVAPRYFEVAAIPIVRGRDFRGTDNLAVLPDLPAQYGARPPDPPGPPRVAIVNEAFARHFFAGQSAIGRRLCLGEKWDSARTYEVVGVAADAHYSNLRQGVEPMVYLPPYRESDWSGGILCIRTAGDPKGIIGAIRRKVQEIDPAVMVTETRTMESYLNRALLQERFVAALGGFFGVVALLLAGVGLYGVMSQAVTRRTREIGIRIALGAETSKVVGMVMRDALIMVAIGAAVGVAAVLALTRYTESLLFGVKPEDPVTIAAAASLICAVTALAGLLPSLRAAGVQPMEALRHQ
jgi:predicted permease